MPHPSQRNLYRRSTLASELLKTQAMLAAQGGETRKALNARVKAQQKLIDAIAKELKAPSGADLVALVRATAETAATVVATEVEMAR